jgi:transposase
MRSKRVEYTDSERTEIQSELRKDHPVHVYKRLMVLKIKAIDGKRSDETGKLLGLNASSVNRIVNRYKKDGMEVIVGKRHNGGNRYMRNEEETAFLERFREQGEAGKVIEVTDIHLGYQKEIGRPVTRNAIYYLLERHGWRKIMPRGRHPKKANAEAIEAYKKNHRNDPNPEKEAAEPAGDVSGRGWVWADQ